jgi:hypothetical protein
MVRNIKPHAMKNKDKVNQHMPEINTGALSPVGVNGNIHHQDVFLEINPEEKKPGPTQKKDPDK